MMRYQIKMRSQHFSDEILFKQKHLNIKMMRCETIKISHHKNDEI